MSKTLNSQSNAFWRGVRDYEQGNWAKCPYKLGSLEAYEWSHGWKYAENEEVAESRRQ